MNSIPSASSPDVAARMSRQRTRDTGAEMALRRELHSRGLRYRVSYRVPGMARRSIDVAFIGPRLAVFVDGCFWHGCPAHGVSPKANGDWWRRKLEANRIRDNHTTAHLAGLGWEVVRVWEHTPITEAADIVERAHAARSVPTRRS